MSPFHRNTTEFEEGETTRHTTEEMNLQDRHRWMLVCTFTHTFCLRPLSSPVVAIHVQYNRRVSVDRALSEMAECCGFESHLRQLICLWQWLSCVSWVVLCCLWSLWEWDTLASLPAAKNTQRVSTCIVCVSVWGEGLELKRWEREGVWV